MGQARGRRGPQKHLKTCQTSLYFVSETSHIIPASRIGWRGHAHGRRGPWKHVKTCQTFLFLFQRPATSQPEGLVGRASWAVLSTRNTRKTCQTFLFCFRAQPHHSSQQDRLDGPSPWSPWAPETFEKPVTPLYFVSEASHIIPASRMGWMGGARVLCGPQKHSKTLSYLFILLQRPATSFQPAGSWAKWAPETFENPVKPLYFVSEASHIIPASRIGWMGQARGRRGPQKHSKTCDHFNEKASLSRYRTQNPYFVQNAKLLMPPPSPLEYLCCTL
jgi:hypothetical protein